MFSDYKKLELQVLKLTSAVTEKAKMTIDHIDMIMIKTSQVLKK